MAGIAVFYVEVEIAWGWIFLSRFSVADAEIRAKALANLIAERLSEPLITISIFLASFFVGRTSNCTILYEKEFPLLLA